MVVSKTSIQLPQETVYTICSENLKSYKTEGHDEMLVANKVEKLWVAVALFLSSVIARQVRAPSTALSSRRWALIREREPLLSRLALDLGLISRRALKRWRTISDWSTAQQLDLSEKKKKSIDRALLVTIQNYHHLLTVRRHWENKPVKRWRWNSFRLDLKVFLHISWHEVK